MLNKQTPNINDWIDHSRWGGWYVPSSPFSNIEIMPNEDTGQKYHANDSGVKTKKSQFEDKFLVSTAGTTTQFHYKN